MDDLPAEAKMDIGTYYHQILMPANVMGSAMRRAGLHVNVDRATRQMAAWEDEIKAIEQRVVARAAACGVQLHYSPKHACLPDEALVKYLFEKLRYAGEPLIPGHTTDTGRPSTDDESLLEYAAVGSFHNVKNGQPFADMPEVYDILKVRSIAKAQGTHLGGLLKHLRSDGCVHAKQNWHLPNTTRISMEEPPLHQLPERADPEIAKLFKACITPRVNEWLGDPADWDPRKHGWCAKVDVKGAEAVIRAGCIAKCRVATPYLRTGGDIHSKTASIMYQKPEGTYPKGTPEREIVGKQSFFRLIFGGSPQGLPPHLWLKARTRISPDEGNLLFNNFFAHDGYYDIGVRYEVDTTLAVERQYIEDPFGRRWYMPMPTEVDGQFFNGKWLFHPKRRNVTGDELKALMRQVDHVRHCYANRPTQSANGTTTLWCLALCHHGEYVPLQAPDYWKGYVPFPEAAHWQLNEGAGPGGKPFRAWITNTVHDSGWFDGAPGTLESAMMLIYRRFTGVPAPYLLHADLPWRVDIECGPDMANLRPYNTVAKQFGMTQTPER